LHSLLIVLHVIACLVLIGLVLLQSGKEGMGVIFGGGSSSMFGATGAGSILVKITAAVAAVFIMTSLTYNIVTGNHAKAPESIMLDVQMEDKQAAPSQAAPPVPAAPEQAPKQ
jgi:preprotein translocase subunit SecG